MLQRACSNNTVTCGPARSIAIVAGTRTKSGSTNFLRLHVLGEHNQEGVRFFAPKEEETVPAPPPEAAAPTTKQKRTAAKLGKNSSRRR